MRLSVLQAYPGFGDCGKTPSGFTGKGCLGDFPNPALDANGLWYTSRHHAYGQHNRAPSCVGMLPTMEVLGCRFSMNMFTIDADNLIGAQVFGVRKADLLSGNHSSPSVVTFTDWAPYPGFTIMPSITQASCSPNMTAHNKPSLCNTFPVWIYLFVRTSASVISGLIVGCGCRLLGSTVRRREAPFS